MLIIDLEEFGINKISFYLALEEYLLDKQIEAFFFWRIGKSIIIGRHQLLINEININEVKSLGCEVFRRRSGGGAIYADEGCFMYSFISKVKNKDLVYKEFLCRFKDALNSLNLNVEFSGRNDLLFNGKKFSGTAYYQNQNGSVLHGTFLYDSNLENLVKCLTPSESKLLSKGIKSVKSRVINIKDFIKMTKNDLILGLEERLNWPKIVIGEDEIKKVRELEVKYLDKQWIFDNNPPYFYRNKIRFKSGEYEVFIDCINNLIKNIEIKGDFFTKNDLNCFYKLFINIRYEKEAFDFISDDLLDLYFDDLNKEDFLKLIFGG